MAAPFTEIPYAKYSTSNKLSTAAKFHNILGKYLDKVTPSSDHPELPQPSVDPATLERDFMRWGYCLVKDALGPEEIEAAKARLLDQSEAEKAAKVAQMGSTTNDGKPWGGSRQLVSNLACKGAIFRKIASYETLNGALVERLMHKILGPDLLIASMHGVVVGQGAGIQSLHQDQSFPLPHPVFPLHANIIYLYTDFSLENGGTYVVPGSALDANGAPLVTPDTNPDELIKNSPYGIVSLTAPAGTCFVSDGRLLHAGAPRKAPGVRLSNNVYHCRREIGYQENPWASFTALADASPKLKYLLGLNRSGFGHRFKRPTTLVPVGELSMSRPEELEQDFDFYYSPMAKAFEKETKGATAWYKGKSRL